MHTDADTEKLVFISIAAGQQLTDAALHRRDNIFLGRIQRYRELEITLQLTEQVRDDEFHLIRTDIDAENIELVGIDSEQRRFAPAFGLSLRRFDDEFRLNQLFDDVADRRGVRRVCFAISALEMGPCSRIMFKMIERLIDFINWKLPLV